MPPVIFLIFRPVVVKLSLRHAGRPGAASSRRPLTAVSARTAGDEGKRRETDVQTHRNPLHTSTFTSGTMPRQPHCRTGKSGMPIPASNAAHSERERRLLRTRTPPAPNALGVGTEQTRYPCKKNVRYDSFSTPDWLTLSFGNNLTRTRSRLAPTTAWRKQALK